MKKHWPYYLANEPVRANLGLDVIDKFSGERVARTAYADAAAIERAIAAAHGAREAMAAFPPDARRDVLDHCVRRFDERREELSLALCIEAGKPIRELLSESGAEDAESADTSDEPTKGGPEKAAKPRKKKPAGINDK